MASAAAFLTGAAAFAGNPPSRDERLLIAALGDLADGLDLVGVGCGVEVEHDRRSRLDQGLFHPGIGFLGNGLVERGKRVCILGPEHRLRRLQALAGIRRHQRQPAERRFHDPSQAVVETHGRKVGRRTAGDGFTGRRVDQLVGSIANENPLALRAEEEPPVLQRGDHRRRKRIAAGDDPVDALDRLIETVGA